MTQVAMHWLGVSMLAVMVVFVGPSWAEKVQQNLSKGDSFRISVDAAEVVRPANRKLMGISFSLIDDWVPIYDPSTGKWCLAEHAVRAIQALHVPLSRMYFIDPGTSGRDAWDLEGAIDRVAEMCRRCGIKQEDFVIELEQQAHSQSTSPERWAQAVRYSKSKGYGFRYWEVCNEPYGAGRRSDPWTPEGYVEHVKEVYKATKAVDPEAQVGMAADLSAWNHFEATQTDNPMLGQLAGYYDFVCPHYYCHMPDVDLVPLEHITFDGNQWVMEDYVLRMRTLLDKYNPGRTIAIIDTEWGMHGYQSNPTGGRRGGSAIRADRDCNIAGALHRAIRVIYYLNDGMLQGASQWTMLENAVDRGWGIVANDDDRLFTLYYLNYYFGRYVGDQVLSVSGTCPYYERAGVDFGYRTEGTRDISMPKAPVLATRSADGKTLYLIAANGTAGEDVPCHVELKGFQAASAEGKRLCQGIDDDALVNKESDVMSALPVKLEDGGAALSFQAAAHSISYIALTAAK